MNIQEHHHNTADQVQGYLRMALEAVEAVDPPEELRGLAFAKAVDLFSNKTLSVAPIGVAADLSHVRH